MTRSSEWFAQLKTAYPDPADWKTKGQIRKRDVFRFARLWMTEGIPYAFVDKPAVYELAREAFADRLHVHPKEVSISGSGRLGFSLASTKFGKPYVSARSDFDLFLVSAAWFSKLKSDAELFVARFSSGLAAPRNEPERTFWEDNVVRIPDHISRGFVNQAYVPSFDRYPNAQACYAACISFQRIVSAELSAELVRRVSVRVYRDWEAVESQIGGSLVYALRETGHDLS